MRRVLTWPLWAWGCLALAVMLALRLPLLDLPLDRDEGEFMTLAWLWRAGLGLPYRDYLELKPPLNLVPSALAQVLFVDGVRGLRWLALGWQAVTLLLLAGVIERAARLGHFGAALAQGRIPTAFAGAAALIYAFFANSARTQAMAANTETWQSLPLLAGLALLIFMPEYPRQRASWLAAGIAFGLASLFKQSALPALLIFAVVLEGSWKTRSLAALWMSLGLGAVWASAWACFSVNNAGWQFIDATLLYGLRYAAEGQGGGLNRLAGLLLRLGPEQASLWILAGLGSAALLESRAGRLVLAWMAWSLVALGLSGRYYPHYAVTCLAPLSVLAARALVLISNAPAAGIHRFFGGRGSLLASLALLMGLLIHAWPVIWAKDGAEQSVRLYGLQNFSQAPLAGKKLADWTRPDERIFVWGAEAEIYYYARRAPASRFLYHYPFDGTAPALPEEQAALLDALTDIRTGAVVVSASLDVKEPLHRDLAARLEDFHLEETLPGLALGRRKR